MPLPTDSQRITRIRKPPRPMPPGLWCRVLFDRKGLFWLAFVSFWAICLCFCAGDMRPLGVFPLRLWGVRVPAKVLAVEDLHVKVGSGEFLRVDYAFDAGGTQRRAEAFDNVPWKPGDSGTAIYWPAHPEVSRLQRAGQSRFGLTGPLLWVLPLAGFLLAIPTWRAGILRALLLREGAVAEGRLIALQRLKKSLRGRPLYHYAYEFDAGGTRVVGQCDGFPTPEEVARLENAPHGVATFAPYQAPVKPVLYLSRDTAVSILVDALPARYGLGVDSKGYWTFEKARASLAACAAVGSLTLFAALSAVLCAAGFLPGLGR